MESVSSSTFRDALAHFASGVTVVASFTEGGAAGFTATGFTSVSLTPPLVLVCIGKSASVHGPLVGASRFGVSILSERQGWIADQFARPGVDRFRDVSIRIGGVPLIEGAVASLECRKYAEHDAGDHTLLVGQVVAVFVDGGRPLVHCSRQFGAFAPANFVRSPRGVAHVE
jgi:flavin reductase (DIM6/NTAB) family NADH-FMN oxidoreductase RutF